MGLGDWMLKRDCSKEDLDWETETETPGSERCGDAIIELREWEERGRKIDWLLWLLANKKGKGCVLFLTFPDVKRICVSLVTAFNKKERQLFSLFGGKIFKPLIKKTLEVAASMINKVYFRNPDFG